MALKRNMTCGEMVGFIDNELLPQAKLEIQSWIKPRKKQGGYFVVTRQILCMVDFFGATYSGYPFSERKSDKKGARIATSRKAIKFIESFFEPEKTYTKEATTTLYNMYRHGLVHLYQPRALKYNTRRVLQWFFYKGGRLKKSIEVDTPKGKIKFKNVKHLEIIFDSRYKNYYYFPISIDCLYNDFVDAAKKYRDKLKKTKYLQTNWRTAVNAICKPR